MCGRYSFDLSSEELKNYYEQVTPNATKKIFELQSKKYFLQIMW